MILVLGVVVPATFGLGGCGPEGSASSEDGVATVEFAALPLSVSGLALSVATMHLDEILLIGNVPPPPPPPGRPPPPPLPSVDLDALAGRDSVSFSWLPQGLYSRVAFFCERIAIRGTWRGTPVSISIANVMGRPVGLRASMPQELGPGHDVKFDVAVDPTTWFDNELLDDATVYDGAILIDDLHNAPLAGTLGNRIGASFSLP